MAVAVTMAAAVTAAVATAATPLACWSWWPELVLVPVSVTATMLSTVLHELHVLHVLHVLVAGTEGVASVIASVVAAAEFPRKQMLQIRLP
jgi:hypothetical protein